MSLSAPVLAKHMRLAIDGGEPIRRKPWAPWPYFAPDEIEAACRVLRSGKVNYWTGTEGVEFEREFAAYHGRKHAIALANGTVALELALLALGIGAGDEVIVPSRTFIASASCAMARGATPVVADVDINSGTITAEAIERVLSPRTKAVVVVHLAGWPCDMDPILELAAARGFKVIEDCAQAHGAKYRGRIIGSIGDVAAFSFCQDKIMTTCGEGGMLLTDDDAVWQRAWAYKDHGKNYAATHQANGSSATFRWVHESFGSNWRLTEMQSATGRIILPKLNEQVEVRRRNAAILTDELKNHESLRVTTPPDHIYHSYYKYYVYVHPEALSAEWTRDRIAHAIAAEGVPCSVGSCSEIYLEQAFQEAIRPQQRLENARNLGDTSLMFQVHPTLSPADMQDACHAVEKVLAVAARRQLAEVA